MKRIFGIFVWCVITVCVGLGAASAQSMYGDAVKADVKMKYVYSLDEALKLAKKENKLVFVNCFEDWAMPCHGMNKYVFSDQKFADWMDKHFVNLFMDMSTPEGKIFRDRYQIKFMAHYVVLDAEGNLVHRIVGGARLPEFQEKVACALSPETSLVGMNAAYDKGERGKDFLRRYAWVLSTTNDGDRYKAVLDEYFPMLSSAEWSEAGNWFVFSERLNPKDTVLVDYLIEHKADFVKSVGLETVDAAIMGLYSMPVYLSAVDGKGGLSLDGLKSVRETLKKAGIPDDSELLRLVSIAEKRRQGDILGMMELVERYVPSMDVRIARGVDASLTSLIDKGKVERQRIFDYLQGRMAGLDKQAANEYRALLLEAGIEGGMIFEDISLADALKMAGEQGKYVFLDCYTSWCGPCKMMSNSVFVRKIVGDVFNPACVNIKIDMEKGEGLEIAKKYGVIAYPTMLILRPDGSVKYRMQGGTEASHFADKGRYALSPEIAYDTLKAYGSLSTCPLARRADYIIALSDAGDIHSPQESIAAYLKEVEGDKALYPEVWKLCGHFSDTYENPVFQFILKHWRDFSFVDRTELESKAERLIFPRYLEFLAGGMPQAEFDEMRRLVRSVDFRKDYSIVYLNRLTTLWLEKNWKSLMEFYNEEVFELPDAKVRLNLDVLLRYFAKEAPDDVKEQMRAYVEKCLQNPDPKAENGYKNLLKSI